MIATYGILFALATILFANGEQALIGGEQDPTASLLVRSSKAGRRLANYGKTLCKTMELLPGVCHAKSLIQLDLVYPPSPPLPLKKRLPRNPLDDQGGTQTATSKAAGDSPR